LVKVDAESIILLYVDEMQKQSERFLRR